ncbi:hypothetical protein ACJ2A9_15765 [Anaerobacillus sp. MEB173]|uniref:hypothetical protein n=1 Tax=Anaerobacillus sp. MEB173 TaxID=3383345 RepID=UPI003F90B99B
MFDWIPLLFSIILLSLDGFVIAFIFGLKKIRVKLTALMVIAIFTSFIMLFALFFGHVLGEVIPTRGLTVFSGMLLIGIGVYQLISDPPIYRPSFLFQLAIIINIDGLAYGIQAGMNGRGYSFAIFVGIFIFFALVLGIIQGQTLKNPLIVNHLSILPGLIFILLGLSKIIF